MPVTFNEAYQDKDASFSAERRSSETQVPKRGQSIYNRRVSRKGSVVVPNAEPPADGTFVNSDRAYSAIAESLKDFPDLHDDHREQTELETSMGFWKSLRSYPAAAAWSILLSSSIIMEGYDTALLGSLFAYPTFSAKFGNRLPDGRYEVSSGWQTGLMNGAQAGSLIGLAFNGWCCDKFGYKKTYIFAMIMMTAWIFIVFFADTVEMLFAGQLLSGIPWGMFQTLSVSYASEICPVCLRGYLTTYANLCWVIGQVLAAGVLRGFLSNTTEWSYRIPFALQWMFIPPIAIGAIFAPESPWWLIRHGYRERTAVVIKRLMGKNENHDANNIEIKLNEMHLTNEHEKALSAGTNYWDCFRGIDLRRTEVATVTWAVQNLSGSALMGYSTFFYQNAGLPTTMAFNLTLAQYGLGFIGTIGSWVFISYFGRRTLYLAGLIVQCVLMATIGGLGFAPPDTTITEQAKRALLPRQGTVQIRVNQGASWGVGSLLLVFTLCFDLTVGPVCYAIVGESSSTRLRQKTIVIARMLYNICGVIINVLTPKMLNPDAWDWGAKTGLFWAGSCLLCIVWTYFRLPETGGRTYGELTILFENKISARKFHTTKVDQFRSSSILVQQNALTDAEMKELAAEESKNSV